MKSFFTKLGVLLVAASFVAVGCHDYAEDIREVNDKLEASVSEINVSTDALESEIEGLASQHAADKAAAEKALADLKTALQGEIDSDVAAAKEALELAYKAADQLVTSGYQNADAALKAELLQAVNDANAAATEALNSLDAAYKAADVALAEAYKAADVEINKSIAALQGSMSTEIARVEGLISEVSAKVTFFEAAYKNADEILDGKIAALAADLKALDEAYKAADANIEAAYKAADKGLQASIDANSNAIAKLEIAVGELQDSTAKNAAAIEALAAVLEAKAIELQGQIDVNKAGVATNAADIDLLEAADVVLQANIDAAKAAAEKALSDYAAAAADLFATQQAVSELETNLSDLIKANADAIVAEKDARVAAVAAVEKALAETQAALEKADSLNKAELEAKIKKVMDDLTSTINSTKTDLQGKIDAEKSARETAVSTINGQISALDLRIQALENLNIKDRLAAVESLADSSQKTIVELVAAVANLEMIYDKVWSRIQSIVFVPKYADGKATINYASVYDGQRLLENVDYRSVLTYKVCPDTLAEALAKAKESLSFDVLDVKTRGNSSAVINIVEAVGNNEDGTLTLTVEPRGLAKDFYKNSNNMSHSAALIVDNGNDFISSEYTNFYPTCAEKVYFSLYSSSNVDIRGKLTDAAPVESITYSNDSTTVDILKNHYVGFYTEKDPQVKTLDQMQEAGYALEYAPAEVYYHYYLMDIDIDEIITEVTKDDVPYFNAALENGLVTVGLKSDLPTTSVGAAINPVYKYDIYGVDVEAGSIVQIVKEQRVFNLGAQTVNWTYLLDAVHDAYLFANPGASATYTRKFQIPASQIKLDNVLNEKYSDVIASTLKSLTVNGNASTAAVFGYDETTGNATLQFDGFEWGEEYNVVAKYDTGSAVVKVLFSFNTVDRGRDPITITTAPTVSTTEKPLIYVKDMKITPSTYVYSFGDQLYDALGSNIAGIEKADYLADNFNNAEHAHVGVLNTLYDNSKTPAVKLKDDEGSDNWKTRIQFIYGNDESGNPIYDFTFGYYYNSFVGTGNFIYTDVKYVKEFYTWYGQKFTIEHVLDIDLPKFNFLHTSYFVSANADNSGYYSKVAGAYSPDIASADVESFSVVDIEMDKAFYVVNDKNEIIPVSQFPEYGITTEFSLEGTFDGVNITNNTLSYYSAIESVPVHGRLFISNSNGIGRVEIPTSFGEGGKYANYIVKKYDPIGSLTVTQDIVPFDVLDKKVYEVNPLEYFVLKDSRNEVEYYDLIVDGAFLVGVSGEKDGYVGDVTAIYDLKVNYSEVTIPAEYVNILSFKDGILRLDNTAQLRLFEDLDIPVTLNISNTWGSRRKTVTIRFKKNYFGEPVTE